MREAMEMKKNLVIIVQAIQAQQVRKQFREKTGLPKQKRSKKIVVD